VLILGAAARIAIPIARLLRRRCGVAVDVASVSSGDRFSSRAVRKFIALPNSQVSPERFSQRLLELVRAERYDMLFPVQDAALAATARNYDALSSLLHVACPPPRVLQRVLNKSFTLQVAEQCGISIPATYHVSKASDVEGTAHLHFPVVLKPAEKKGSEKVKALYFFTREALITWLAAPSPEEFLLQEYCPGVGVGIEMLIHQSGCIAAFQHRRLKESPPTGGVAVMAIAEEPDPQLVAASLRLLRALEWEGVAMVEFRKDPATGNAVLLEINGRYWGTTGLALCAGMEFPVYQWQLAHGQSPSIPKAYKVGTRWRWTAGYLSRLHSVLLKPSSTLTPRTSRLKEIAQLPLDWSPAIKDALFSFSDPGPAFHETLDEIIQTAKSDIVRVLPRDLRLGWNAYAQIGPKARRIYLRSLILDKLHIRSMDQRTVPAGARSFVFVCFGNIMRSAMAEAIFLKVLAEHGHEKEVHVVSAGLHAIPGREAHPWAQIACEHAGLSIAAHRSKLVTIEMIEQADAVFAMDFQNRAELLTRYPEAQHKIFMMTAYGDSSERSREISDPYFGNEESTKACFGLLESCIRRLEESLFSRTEPSVADSPLENTPKAANIRVGKGISNA